MRQRICWLSVVALLAFACAPAERPAAGAATLSIMATVLPIQNLTLALTNGAPNVQVRALVPAATGCPHDYILQPGDLKALENSHLLIAVGLGYEPFLDKLAANYQGRLTIVRVGEGVDLLQDHDEPAEHGERRKHGEHGAGEHHRHEATGAEHPFASPKQAATMALNLAETLAARDPANAALYRANGATLKDELLAIHDDLAKFVAALPNKRVAIASTVLAYLARDLGLQPEAVLSGDEHHELSAGEIAAIIANLKKAPPAAILVDLPLDPKTARMIAGEVGARVIELEVGLSGAAGPDASVATWRRSAAALKAGLTP